MTSPFEALIEIAANDYRRQGLACVKHTFPETKFIGWQPEGKTYGKVVGKGAPDYVGTLGKSLGGRAIAFEAKSISNKQTWATRERLHQYRDLRDYQGVNGGDTFGYLIEWKGVDEVRWHPLHTITVIERGGEIASLRFRREDGDPVPTSPDGVPDWIAPFLLSDERRRNRPDVKRRPEPKPVRPGGSIP